MSSIHCVLFLAMFGARDAQNWKKKKWGGGAHFEIPYRAFGPRGTSDPPQARNFHQIIGGGGGAKRTESEFYCFTIFLSLSATGIYLGSSHPLFLQLEPKYMPNIAP